MKTIIFCITLLLFSLGLQKVNAQEVASKEIELSSEERAKKFFEKEQAKIVTEEKEKLKYRIEIINGQLENGIITQEAAKKKKKGIG